MKVLLAAIRAVHRVCTHVLDSGVLALSHESATDDENAGLMNFIFFCFKTNFALFTFLTVERVVDFFL